MPDPFRMGGIRSQGSMRGENLDAVVGRVRHIKVPEEIGPHTLRIIDQPITPRTTGGDAVTASPLGKEIAVRIELLQASVAKIGDDQVPGRVHRHPDGRVQLPIAAPKAAPIGSRKPRRK